MMNDDEHFLEISILWSMDFVKTNGSVSFSAINTLSFSTWVFRKCAKKACKCNDLHLFFTFQAGRHEGALFRYISRHNDRSLRDGRPRIIPHNDGAGWCPQGGPSELCECGVSLTGQAASFFSYRAHAIDAHPGGKMKTFKQYILLPLACPI